MDIIELRQINEKIKQISLLLDALIIKKCQYSTVDLSFSKDYIESLFDDSQFEHISLPLLNQLKGKELSLSTLNSILNDISRIV
jgi:hypothetical protein